MKKLLFIFAAVLFFAGTTVVNAQDTEKASHRISINIDTHAMVDVEADNGEAGTINLAPTAPEEAGLGLNFENISNSDLWLNYSSIVRKNRNRSISASMDKDLPEGMTIKLAVSSDKGEGKGNVGEAANTAQSLTKNGVTIVSNIKSCYTGNGYEKGHNLTYSLKMNEDNYGDLEADAHVIEITYTISGD